ncbi:MAG: hypothetical protein ACI8P0_000422, partial [Planctomycetaceae bacterium]
MLTEFRCIDCRFWLLSVVVDLSLVVGAALMRILIVG